MTMQGVWRAIQQKEPKIIVDDKTFQVALEAIYQGVSEDVLLAVADKETPKEAWESIKMMCMGVEWMKKAKVQNLNGEFESLMIMKETNKIDEFYMRLRGIVTNGRVLWETMEQWSAVRKILHAVPNKFLQIASNIEQFGVMKVMMVEEIVDRLN